MTLIRNMLAKQQTDKGGWGGVSSDQNNNHH